MAEKSKKSVNKQPRVEATKTAGTMMKVQYYRSMICTPEKHKRVVKGLGFTRLNQVVRARGHAVHSRHGQYRAASGQDRRVVVGSVFETELEVNQKRMRVGG